MKPWANPKGYLNVNLATPDRKLPRRFQVHRLVMLAFVGDSKQEVRHLDGDPGNNRLSNLAYGTSSVNQHDSVAHGTHRSARVTHCKWGHPYDEVNTYRYTNAKGQEARDCRICRHNRSANRKRKR